MSSDPRPLSPHLQVYRFGYTMALSILHRASGAFLSACTVLLVAWLVAAAAGPEPYARLLALYRHPLVLLLIAGGMTAFWYHLCAGLRHLAWDAGLGFEKPWPRRTGWLMVAVFAVVAGTSLAVAWSRYGAAS